MSFFRSLFLEPKDFRGQPYEYLTNQVGHIFIGGAAPIYFLWFIYHVSGVWPNQEFVAGFLLVSYLALWELGVQKFRGWDTFFDTFFVGVGASLHLFVEMDIVIDRMVTWLTIIALTLLITTYRQYRIQGDG